MKAGQSSESPDEKNLWSWSKIATVSLYVVVAGTVAASVLFLGADLMYHFHSVEEWLKDAGPWALVIFVLLYAVLGTFFVPDTVLGIAAGTIFGFTHGLLAAMLGSLVGATLQYALARRLLRPTVEKFIRSKPALAALQDAVLQQEFRLQLLIRLTPLNRTLTNYMLGAAGVGFIRFIAACAGFLPILCLEVYFGVAGKQMVGEASQPGHVALLHDVMLLTGLVIAIIVMVIISRMARRAVEAVAVAAPNATAIEDSTAAHQGRAMQDAVGRTSTIRDRN